MISAPAAQARNTRSAAGLKKNCMVFLSCLLSAALLVLSFPRIEFSFLAWFALVPLLFILDGKKSWRAFRRGWFCGFLFFLALFGWIVYVTYIGAFFLAAFLALYFGLFGVLFVYFQARLSLTPRLLVLSAVWVVLEFIRAHFLSGFGWGMLAHTQYQNLWLIQISDKTGIYGISFLVMLVNLLIFEIIKARRLLAQATLIVAVILLAVLVYGYYLIHEPRTISTVRVGVVQPNISLAEDWDDAQKPAIVDKTIQLTRQLRDDNLDLIVWPETALPGVVTDSPSLLFRIREEAALLHSSLMIGSMAQDGDKYFNSGFLIGPDGQMLGHYDKMHLVPFGEYLPYRPVLGWIDKYVPIEDFTPGKDYKTFPVGPGSKKFSVLICFEDTLGDLDRHFALAGAQFFVNITNDAWFEDTRAPFMHLQGAVLSCVENHRALARAANTGVSAIIDPWGRIITTVHDGHGKKTFMQGVAWGEVPLTFQQSFYTKYGDVFTLACFLCILMAVAF